MKSAICVESRNWMFEMPVIAPTVTACDLHEYRLQMERLMPFAKRIHLDLMDGIFAPTKSPDIDKLWLPEGVIADVHIMFQHPFNQLKKILRLNPYQVTIQAEAQQNSVDDFIRAIKKTKVRLGIALLASTHPETPRVKELIKKSDYVLVFSGNLGYHGGSVDFSLLDKIPKIKSINPKAEIGWDGGIAIENVATLVRGGVDVLNVGGSIQKASDPTHVYNELMSKIAPKTD